MKTKMSLVYAIILMAGLVLVGRPTPIRAADDNDVDRLARLEQRINQIAEQQEHFMKQMGAQMQQRGQMEPPNMRPPGAEMRPELRPELMPGGALPAAGTNPRWGSMGKSIHCLLGLLLLIGFVCNILLAIWIYTDIRKRGEGSGIFIAVALVAGIPAALIYALTRIGDRKS